ncbi:MAG: right-handed parallel beta-helix repeat-containing protein, partial [Candidatus Thermoplasmatota archaeon]|nr:right-handed parallel beta-helix repeat-containing protein [Candidatus Thermoplasmatota archaeon]
MIGPSTTINGLIIRNSGDSSSNDIPLQSGFYLRSANWAPTIDDLEVSGSTGAGIHLMKSSLRGTNWNVHNNSGIGLHIQESHPEIEGVQSSDNGLNGVFVYDSSNVLLVNASSTRNGGSATEISEGVGFLYRESNTLTASTKDVTCRTCSSIDDTQGGVIVQDSIDLVLENHSISLPEGVGPGLQIDNSGISFPGVVTIKGMSIYQDETSSQAVAITSSDAIINNLILNGNHTGIIWSGSGSSGLNSYLNNSIISGQNCLLLTNHENLTIHSPDYSSCSGSFTVQSSQVSFVDAPDASGLQLTQPGLSQTNLVQWISSDTPPSLNQAGVAQFDVMWKIHVWAVNQNGFGLPYSVVNLSFDQIENPIQHTLPYAGNAVLGPFVGTRTTSQGTTNVNQFWTGCEYSSNRNDTGPEQLNSDKISICEIQLPDQPPLILWSTPIHEQLFPSGGEVIFNASETWDLENQELTYFWNSSLDGSLIDSCLEEVGSENNKSFFIANNQSSGCLTDGTHDITLEVCDISNNCATETRRIELTNLPPSISVVLTPLADVTNRILLSRTQVLHLNASASVDPENQPFQTSLDVSFSEWADDPGDCSTPNCPLEYNISFEDSPNAVFDLTFVIGDGLNTPLTYSWSVELYNELPSPDLQVSRESNLSSAEITLDARGTVDPEGDQITYRFYSNIDGELDSRSSHLHNGQDAPPEGVWIGHLSPGAHTITLGVGDSDSSHSGAESLLSILLIVNNSVPIATISSPSTGYSTDSSDLIRFESTGSGDWDLSCDSVEDTSPQILCNPYIGASDLVSVLWTSNQLTDPLGSGWILDSRLPAGIHDVTLTVDDGSGQIAQSTIRIDVSASAPLLILDSPEPGAVVVSDAPILFDFRQSYDPDGDSFNVTITSNLESEPMVENGTIEYWYNDYMSAGEHIITVTLTDEHGLSRVYTQSLQVLPSDPFAVIANISEGTSIPPGETIEVIGADSYDYDDDIFRYEWRIDSPSGTVVSTMPNFTYKPTPGLHLIHLTVIDQRGGTSTTSVNITSLSSSPRLSDLMYEPSNFVADESYEMIISVILDDPDGTTNQVQARIAMNG